jgi:uncharacterized protein YndB with AHSA1/START domain
LITVAMSAVIGASTRRVWQALTVPREIAMWDERVVAPVDETDDYPCVGRPMRWRYRLGGVPLVMHEEPLEVVPGKRLHSRLTMGSLRYEQTYSIVPLEPTDEVGGPNAPRTQLGMRLVASNSVPVVGDVVDRFEVRRMTVRQIATSLDALQAWLAPGATPGPRGST